MNQYSLNFCAIVTGLWWLMLPFIDYYRWLYSYLTSRGHVDFVYGQFNCEMVIPQLLCVKFTVFFWGGEWMNEWITFIIVSCIQCKPSLHGLIGHQKRKERTKPDPEHNWISTITSAHQKLIKQMYLSSFPGLRNKASSFKHIENIQTLQLLLIRAPTYFRVLSIDFMK